MSTALATVSLADGCEDSGDECTPYNVTVASIQAAHPELPTTCNADTDCTLVIEGDYCGCPEEPAATTVALASKFNEAAAARHCSSGCTYPCDSGVTIYGFRPAGACHEGKCVVIQVDAGCLSVSSTPGMTPPRTLARVTPPTRDRASPTSRRC